MSAALGVALAIFGGVVDNVGVSLQKLSHNRYANAPEQKRFYACQPLWVIGISLYLLGNGINAVALGMAPQSLFASLGPLSLVTNTITSRLILKERVNWTIILGTAVIILGAALTISFGSHENSELMMSNLLSHLSAGFIVFATLLVSAILGMYFLASRFRRSTATLSKKTYNSANLESGEFEEIELDDRLSNKTHTEPSNSLVATELHPIEVEMVVTQATLKDFYISIAYPTIAGMIGAFTQIVAKILSVFISETAQGNNYFTTVWPYLFIVAVGACGTAQVHFINLGLKDHDQLIVIPAFVVSLETFSVIAGLVFWEEFHSFTLFSTLLFLLGIVLGYTGIYITTRGRRMRRMELLRAQAGPDSLS